MPRPTLSLLALSCLTLCPEAFPKEASPGLPQGSDKAALAANHFGIDLYQKLCAEDPGKNLCQGAPPEPQASR